MHYNIYAIQNHTMPDKQISLTIPDDSVEKFKAAEEQFVAKHSSLQILWLKHQRPLREVQIRLKVRVTAGTHLCFDSHHCVGRSMSLEVAGYTGPVGKKFLTESGQSAQFDLT